MLHKPITSEFITTACINFFVVAITPITMTLVVIAMTFFVVLSPFSCSVSNTLIQAHKYARVYLKPIATRFSK